MPDNSQYNPPNEELVELLNLVAQDNEAAFTKLLRRYWNKVYTQALTYLHSSELAQELTQDVFLKIWTNRIKLPKLESFPNFLFILSRNEIISALRRKGKDHGAGAPDSLEEALWKPDLQLEYKESYTRVLKGIDALPPTRKIVFKMSRLEGLGYEEIAQKMGISRDGVKDHIVKALGFLRTWLRTDSGDSLITLLLLILLAPN